MMKTLALGAITAASLLFASPTWGQGNVPDAGAGVSTGICVVPTYVGGDGRPHPCSTLPSAPAKPAANMNQAIANAGAAAILDLVGGLLSGNKKDEEARNSAAAVAAAAEQERQAKLARQRALEEQKRQQMFDRLSQSLKLSGLATLSLKGFDNNPGLHLKGFGDTPTEAEADLQLKGLENSESSNLAPSQHVGTSPFGLGGNPCPAPTATAVGSNFVDLRSDNTSACPKVPTGDPNVVDLRDVQQGVNLAVLAANAPPADRQFILDQALDAANGNHSVQVKMASSSTAPEVSQDGLQAFQQANAAYWQARDSAYQHQQLFNQEEEKREAAYAIVSTYQAQLANDFQNHIDAMTVAQKQETMAKIFDAALQERISYGKTWAEYLAASAQYDFRRRAAQDELMRLAETGPYDPALRTQGPPDSDLKLLLPVETPTQVPTKADLGLLLGVEVTSPSTEGPAELALDFPSDNRLRPDELREFPPAVAHQYKSDSSFQHTMNAQHLAIFAERDRAAKTAVSDLRQQFDGTIAEMEEAGTMQPGVSISKQEKANPQLHVQLQRTRALILADFECKLAHANWQANDKWQAWIEAQNALLTGKPAPIYVPAP